MDAFGVWSSRLTGYLVVGALGDLIDFFHDFSADRFPHLAVLAG